MPTRAYVQPGLTLAKASPAKNAVTDLQRDLRALGYLRRGIDGDYGAGTEKAVMALQHDLLRNDGGGKAPVRMIDFAKGRVNDVNGVVDQSLAAIVGELTDDARIPKLPRAVDRADAIAQNERVAEAVAALPVDRVPPRFLVALLRQESGLTHFAVPRDEDEDTFIVVGTDHGDKARPFAITSRGYGAGQYTLFHHPPTTDEVQSFMLDPVHNVERAVREVREKFDGFVTNKQHPAQDRVVEIGLGTATPLRTCKFATTDERFMRDCRTCADEAGRRDTAAGLPVFAGSSTTWAPVKDLYETAVYTGVPKRERIGCDWPYAIRRYNGDGLMSYHYQARVLRFLGNG